MTHKKVSFWRIFLASLIAGIVLIAIFIFSFSSLISSLMEAKPTYKVEKNTVLHLQLDGKIGEMSKNEFKFTNLQGLTTQVGLADLMYGFKKAAEDDQIKGVFIELDGAHCGYTTATDIRNAIKRFEKQSGKFVIAYNRGEVISLNEYYIASAASENYGFHSSVFDFKGLGAQIMFYKGLFDKLDVKMQVIRGKGNDFKSAVEPFFRKEMSDSSRLQMMVYLHNIWSVIKGSISKDRGISVAELDSIANNMLVRRVTEAVNYNLIDSALYRDQVLQIIAQKTGLKEVEDLHLSSFEDYARHKFQNQQSKARAKDANIAVIVAQGGISVAGDGIASEKIVKLFRKARNDDAIKTIVFRVNSPGGSALASEEIWREVQLANNQKNVIVSMGDLAASGGYYISTPASKIFAEKTTITGSIGVFGVIPYTGKMLENKLGITFDKVSTNPHAVFSLNKKLTPEELEVIQGEVNNTYFQFLQRVADGRGMTVKEVNKIARGRVWTGGDALQIGLVDTLGSLQDAINYAAQKASIEDPIIRYYPKVEEKPWMEIIQTLEDNKVQIQGEIVPQEWMDIYQHIMKIEEFTGIQARLPYQIIW